MVFSQKKYNPNYDESKVPQFNITNPLVTFDGEKINSTAEWYQIRRPELYTFFEESVYGKIPEKIDELNFETIEQSEYAINNKASRKQVKITISKNNKSISYTVLIYLPKGKTKAPIFLSTNFRGNHTINADPNIILTDAWVPNTKELGITDHKAQESSRGTRTHRWPVEKIIDGGFGLATIYYGEIDPDKNDFTDGIHNLFYREGQKKPKPNEWGSITAWAFALSKTLDYFETDPAIDEKRTIVFGHSRLGKTSLWAGASDDRFAGVISNDSGCGGATLSKRKFGETIAIINNAFPHWFSDTFNKYIENESALPVDQHELLALIAPRPLYVASAQDDKWADPKGEFLSAHYASAVYNLFEKEGVSSTKMPIVNEPIQNTVAYHIRTGKHDVTDFDWEQYIKWAKKYIE
ncbi:acetylxylan esterase [Kriegella sp. EG-1]|nr:acetylxylan esterase [Flavobacteriaceae bacterium EG-1]